MPIAFRSAVASATTASATTAVLTIPTGVIVGDFMIMSVAFLNTSTYTVPTGWTEITRRTVSSETTVIMWRYGATGAVAGSTVTHTFGTANRASAYLSAYSGTHASAPIDCSNSADGAAGTTHLVPNATTVAAGCVAVKGVNERSGTAVSAWTSPDTERCEGGCIGSGGTSGAISDDLTPVGAGSTIGGGNFVSTNSASTTDITWVVGIAPAPSAGSLIIPKDFNKGLILRPKRRRAA